MNRVQTNTPRNKKGKSHYLYTISDKDIAKTAGVSVGAVVAARFRKQLTDLRSIILWVNLHKLVREMKERDITCLKW